MTPFFTDIIVITVIISLIIFTVIYYYVTVKRHYKNDEENLKVGDKYTYTIECKIVEIRYGKDKIPYVKYEFTDGSGNIMRFDKFIKNFDKAD